MDYPMSSKDLTKSIRLHILVDEPFRKAIAQAAHDSWMSVGQYLRDTVGLFGGACYDDAADLVMIGREVGLDGLEQLREAALRKGITVNDLCNSIGKTKTSESSKEKN